MTNLLTLLRITITRITIWSSLSHGLQLCRKAPTYLALTNKLRGKKLYASTLTDNTATISLLSKLGFKRYVPEDGLILIMEGFIDEESDEFLGYCVSKYVIEKTD